ncbi:PREDICTED: uncharacterized protein LOC104805942 [Tarenaya hassleriana]|uniref:uncharacterized protein LOC104805942 n=1 Tax=Tarenaya hassleriana TaxID=28532 RepID=UPI00053C6841|nr:PREDICTED: uncharacterized protein LOC104805942 [Tarenaya hassleriana]
MRWFGIFSLPLSINPSLPHYQQNGNFLNPIPGGRIRRRPPPPPQNRCTSLSILCGRKNSPTNHYSSRLLRRCIGWRGRGAHYGDLVANLLLGLTVLWLPLTLAAVSRAFNLRYRFTNLRVTVISGLTGEDRSDFSYTAIKDVKVVPRFIGEWGDIVITLKDGTKVDLRSVPKFREIAKYCLAMADQPAVLKESAPKGF